MVPTAADPKTDLERFPVMTDGLSGGAGVRWDVTLVGGLRNEGEAAQSGFFTPFCRTVELISCRPGNVEDGCVSMCGKKRRKKYCEQPNNTFELLGTVVDRKWKHRRTHG